MKFLSNRRDRSIIGYILLLNEIFIIWIGLYLNLRLVNGFYGKF